jgi:hypothetical protein
VLKRQIIVLSVHLQKFNGKPGLYEKSNPGYICTSALIFSGEPVIQFPEKSL